MHLLHHQNLDIMVALHSQVSIIMKRPSESCYPPYPETAILNVLPYPLLLQSSQALHQKALTIHVWSGAVLERTMHDHEVPCQVRETCSSSCLPQPQRQASRYASPLRPPQPFPSAAGQSGARRPSRVGQRSQCERASCWRTARLSHCRALLHSSPAGGQWLLPGRLSRSCWPGLAPPAPAPLPHAHM